MGSDPEITNNVIASNNGFGIQFKSFHPKMINNTVMGNEGGVFMACDSLTILNTILWGNGSCEIEVSEFFESPFEMDISHSDIQGGQAGIIKRNNMLLNWGEGNINAEPLFVDWDNGDYHLSNLSPCISMGIMTEGVPPVDIEGNPRPDPPGSKPDIGAYESIWGTLPAGVKSGGKQKKPWGGLKAD